MKSNHRSPIWPYLIVLVALFTLCVTAPRGWQTKPTSHRPHSRERQVSYVQRKPQHETATVLRAQSSREANTVIGKLAASHTAINASHAPRPTDNPLASSDGALHSSAPVAEPPDEPYVTLQVDQATTAQNPPGASDTESFVSTNIGESAGTSDDMPTWQDRDQTPESAPQVGDTEGGLASGSIDGDQGDEDDARNYDNWPLPVAIIDRLERLQCHAAAHGWANEIRLLVDQLAKLRIDDSEAKELLARLRGLTGRAPVGRGKLLAADQREFEQLQLDLVRRVALWEKAAQASSRELVSLRAIKADSAMQQALSRITASLARAPVGETWRNYLMLTRLSRLAGEAGDDALAERHRIAQIVLARIAEPRLTGAQKRLLAEPPLVELKRHLRRWTVEQLPVGELLYTVEDYEQARVTSLGRTLAEQSALLAASRDASEERLGCELARQYRNANLRIVATRELLNRLMPQPQPAMEPVNDTVVGFTARGQSTTSARLSVRLFPARDQIRLGIEAQGIVDAQTASTAGPVTFYSQGESSYRVGKLVVIDKSGLRVGRALADADNQTRLSGLQTDFDGVPLVRSLVRGYALAQHEEKQGQARQEVEAKVAARASQRLDAEVNTRLAKAESDLRHRILAPLQKIAIVPEVVQLTTTQERVTARLRLAGDDQAGAHTPRPLAMSDSLLSLQVHETALNNALDQFRLAGRTFTLPELYQWIGGLLGRMRVELPEDLPENVSITFADKDPLRVRCGDGLVELTLAVAELDEGRRVWHDFEITVFYRPHRDGLRLEFAREGAIELSGAGYKGRTEIVLRGIFAKVFSHRRKLTFDPARDNSNPALATLAFSSALVDNGWISITVADARLAGGHR